MSTQLSKSDKSLKGMLSSDAMQKQFAAALPAHLSPERFTRVSLTALTRTPKLLDCTPESFFKCLLDLSAVGLEPDGRRAHLIPYGKECTLVLDYKGIVELMRNSGDVSKIHSDVVCENDVFRHSKGEILEHTYDLKEPRGDVYAAYTEVTFKDGSTQSAIMSKSEIDGIRKRSKAGNNGPWVSDYNEMAKKTTLRRVSKLVPLSPEIRDVFEADQRAEFEGLRNVTKRPEVRKEPINPFDQDTPALETVEEVEAPEGKEEGDEDLW